FGVLSKFDDTTWTTYNFDDVHKGYASITADKEGNIWFGTKGGISKFDGVNRTIYTEEVGLASNDVSDIAVDLDGNIWFGTLQGVSRFDGTNWTTYDTIDGLAYNSISDIAVDIYGNIWFRYWDPGVITKFDTNHCTNYSITTGHVGIDSDFDMVIDSQGNWWFSTICCFWSGRCGPECRGLGVLKFDGTNWTHYTTRGLASNDVKSIAIDAKGNKWFGCQGHFSTACSFYGGGVSKFNNTIWTNYVDCSLDFVSAIAIDAEGNKWFGSERGGGVSKFDDTTWTIYTTEDGLASNYINAIAIDAEGNKWFGTHDGVSKFDDTTWTTYTTEDGLAGNWVNAIAIDLEGNKWFVCDEWYDDSLKLWWTGGGVTKFNDVNWRTYTTADGLASNDVHAIAIDAEGNKWFGCFDPSTGQATGVTKFDGINWTTYTTADGLVSNWVNAIAIDLEGNKWFGCNSWLDYSQGKLMGGGVTKFDGINWTTYITADGLIGNNVRTIAIDADGSIWLGTEGGVSKLSESNEISPITNTNHLNLYPNPVQNVLHINLSGKTAVLLVFDISGKCLFQKQIKENESSVDVSGLVSGIYFVKVMYNNQIFTEKVVKY
ncbi:MAG: hypothetical protein A3K77_06440, partial [Euryarchaeota archaeon RBG_13_31_8]